MVNYWILIGDEESLKTAFDVSLWGVKESLKNKWDNLKENDILFFYAKNPVKSIIFTGVVLDKFIGTDKIWKDEIEIKKIIYPYRIKFKIEKRLQKEVRISTNDVSLMSGLNQIKNPEVIKKIKSQF